MASMSAQAVLIAPARSPRDAHRACAARSCVARAVVGSTKKPMLRRAVRGAAVVAAGAPAAAAVACAAAPRARARRIGAPAASPIVSQLPRVSGSSASDVALAAASAYVPPSFAPGETELARVARFSTVVADTLVPEAVRALAGAGVATAAVVSHGSLLRATAAPSREFEAALAGALAYDKARLPGGKGADLSMIVDKAMVNIGADLASIVAGRVSTELDARLAGNTEALVAKAQRLAAMYKEMGVGPERLLFRVPATWEALEAVARLEAAGMACHVHDVYSVQQAAAAAHVGASVIQPSVLSLQDWAVKHPNAPLPGAARGTRGDAGDLAQSGGESRATKAGRGLAAATLAYLNALPAGRRARTKLMTHARSADDVRALAGADFVLAPVAALTELAGQATFAGYNDGISPQAASSGKETSPLEQRAAEAAAEIAAAFPAGGVFSGDRSDFEAGLAAGPGKDLLAAAVKRAATNAIEAEALFQKLWPPAGGM